MTTAPVASVRLLRLAVWCEKHEIDELPYVSFNGSGVSLSIHRADFDRLAGPEHYGVPASRTGGPWEPEELGFEQIGHATVDGVGIRAVRYITRAEAMVAFDAARAAAATTDGF